MPGISPGNFLLRNGANDLLLSLIPLRRWRAWPMAFDPMKEKGIPLDRQLRSWRELAGEPYDKASVDPYTRCRVIAMNGVEVESIIHSHQFARHTADMDLKRQLAAIRRVEQQQQKAISGLVPGEETILEHTIGYEQVAVDLTAWVAQQEPDPYAKQA